MKTAYTCVIFVNKILYNLEKSEKSNKLTIYGSF